MISNIALQLYSVRELTAKDFDGTVRKIAAMGYDGVETAGFPGTTPEAASKLFAGLGLKVAGAHSPAPVGDKKNEILDTMAALGCKNLIIPSVRPEEVKTVDSIKRACDMLNEAQQNAAAAGLRLGLHNHWWEMDVVDGKHVYQIMKDLMSPEIFYELDTYWIKVGGLDPVDVVKELGQRAPYLHLKDGPGIKEDPMVALGSGIMDFPSLLEASQPYREWSIVEFDRCALDILVEIEKSIRYLRTL